MVSVPLAVVLPDEDDDLPPLLPQAAASRPTATMTPIVLRRLMALAFRGVPMMTGRWTYPSARDDMTDLMPLCPDTARYRDGRSPAGCRVAHAWPDSGRRQVHGRG